MAQRTDVHTAAYEARSKQLPGAGVAWLDKVREEALATFQRLGIPSGREETWKYTSTRRVRDARLVHPDTAGTIPSEDELAAHLPPGTAPHVVTVDGRVAHIVSEGLPAGVRIMPLRSLLASEPGLVEEYLGRIASVSDNAFTALNTALFDDGVAVLVDDGAIIPTTLHIVHVANGVDEGTAVVQPRVLVIAGTASQSSIAETFVGGDAGRSLTNAVTEVAAGENAVLDHYAVQRQSNTAMHVWRLEVDQTRASNVRSHLFSLGAAWARNELHAMINGEGANAELNGLFMPTGEQHVDNHTRIDHAQPNCESHELYKGILDGRSSGVFTGRIFVAKPAQKTNAIQHNPNMLMSKDALVNSTPQLEIFADDVKCTHGSTTGQLDREPVFYLQSRGLDEATATSMLVYGFAAEVVERVRDAELRQYLRDVVLDRLPNGALVREALE